MLAVSRGCDRCMCTFQHACCGTDHYMDWEGTTFGETVHGVPDACCKENTPGCGNNMFLPGAEVSYFYIVREVYNLFCVVA